jgi:hypothetical protein
VADVKIHLVPDWVIEAHRSRGEACGRTLEEELRSVLTDAAFATQHQFAREASAFRDQLRSKYGRVSDSTPGIVEDRQQADDCRRR